MSEFVVTDPSGKEHVVTAPEGATAEQALEYAKSQFSQAPKSSMGSVIVNAADKAIAGVPDTFLNAPNRLLNLGKAAVGTVATAAGRPDLAPDLTPDPDLARRAFESVGAINPKIVPQGGAQQAADVLTQGAVSGAMTGGASLPQVATGAAMGAISSGAAAGTEALTGNRSLGIAAGIAAPAVAGKVASGGMALSEDVRRLQREGVKMTPGQLAGGALQRIEDAMTSIPLLGDAIKSAQRRGHESFGQAAFNMALAPIGEKLPPSLKGNDAVAYVQDKLRSRYDALRDQMHGSLDGHTGARRLPQSQGQAASPTLRQELGQIESVGQNLPAPQREQLTRIIKNEVVDRFTSAGMASGQTIKDVESKLGGMAASFSRSDNYDVRNLGAAVKETQAALRRMVENENPQYASELNRINMGYSVFKRTQRAASSVAAKDGVFTPAQLHSAVKAGDYSKDKSNFARGDALMQDFSQAGKNVLSQTVPDSGTPYRALMEAAALGGLGQIFNHPLIAAGAVSGTLPYTPIGQRGLQAFLTRNPNPMYSDVAARSGPMSLAEMLAEQGRRK